ncbi:cytochrome b [Toxoplasma gondii]|uniref:Cytochrome b n=1 Tax=Toxoplasma gondii TaxID=5811 RepID=A0A7J6KGQ6_TOXGO|nr:cytochrome b [Toxoplasma gondii]
MELSHPDNSIPVNRFVTPLHIVPEWYFLAYYAVLKVIPSKTGGLLVFMSSLINLGLLSEIRALKYPNVNSSTVHDSKCSQWMGDYFGI